MPLYEYDCTSCGPFRAWTSLSEAQSPSACPDCGGRAPRAIAMPFLARMNPNTRIAHQRNEKAAHEPVVMSRQELQASGRKRTALYGDNRAHLNHHHGCSHGDHHHESKGSSGLRTAHKSTRPWMIGH